MDLLEFSIKVYYIILWTYIWQARPNYSDLYLDVFIVHDGTSFTACCVGCVCQIRKNFNGHHILEYMMKKSNFFEAYWNCTSVCFERLENFVYISSHWRCSVKKVG